MCEGSPAVGRRAPARVGVVGQEAPQLVLLEALQQRPVVQDGAHVHRRQGLRALRAGDAHAALRDLDAQVLAQAVRAGPVRAGSEAGEVAARLAEQAQRALLQVLVQELLLAGGGEGQDVRRAAVRPGGVGALPGFLAAPIVGFCTSSHVSAVGQRNGRFAGVA